MEGGLCVTGATFSLDKGKVKFWGLHPFPTAATGRRTGCLPPVVKEEAIGDDAHCTLKLHRK